MRLCILVNHYNEGPDLIGRLLKSIEVQIFDKNDYEVIICSDGDKYKLSGDFLAQFSFSNKYIVAEHEGVCMTRNKLLDMADSDYIMFCDADDCFSDQNALNYLFKEVDRSNPDVIGSPYNVEHVENGVSTYKVYQNDIIRVHGKLFKRKFIVDEQIRFPNVESNGDMCFLWLAFHLTKNVVWIPENFYIWKENRSSVTRSIKNYGLKRYDRFVECYSEVARYLIAREREDLYKITISSFISVLYLSYNSEKWKIIKPECTELAKRSIASYIKEFRSYYEKIDPSYRKGIYFKRLIAKRMHNPENGFDGIGPWMDEIVEKYG